MKLICVTVDFGIFDDSSSCRSISLCWDVYIPSLQLLLLLHVNSMLFNIWAHAPAIVWVAALWVLCIIACFHNITGNWVIFGTKFLCQICLQLDTGLKKKICKGHTLGYPDLDILCWLILKALLWRASFIFFLGK